MTTQSRATPRDRLLDTSEAAAFLGWRARTLEERRRRRLGPPFVRLSLRSVRYRMRDLERWLDSRAVNPEKGGRT